MAISATQEDKLVAFEEELKMIGSRLSVTEIADQSPKLNNKKLEDALRAAVYIAGKHQRSVNRDWDGSISVDDFMETFRDQL